MVIGLVVIVLVLALPVGYLIWRFKRGGEAVPGGSLGGQVSRRKQDDWGPKS